MNFYGVHGINLAWFKSYLENRQNYVEIDGYKSEITTSSLGVPEGSILGPILFNICINDIWFSSDFFLNFINYTDDTTLLNTLSNKCRNDLSHSTNNELDKVYMLLCTNKLSVNIKKTKFMIFHNRVKHLGIIPNTII